MATFDCESFERPHERDNESESIATVTNAIHKCVSIGVSSNLPGFGNRFFCRKSSSLGDGETIITEFLDHIFDMAEALQKLIPKEIVQAAASQAAKLAGQMFSKGKCEERTLLHHLNGYKKLSIFGFNSGNISYILLLLINFKLNLIFHYLLV